MGQEETVGPLDQAVGYALKQAATALRAAMDAALRPLGLTVSQYACLELLGQHPGLSNAELARGAFVTRQSMNLVLRGLHDRGLVTRPGQAPHGRALPSQLTPAGRDKLDNASAAVRAVERQMLSPLSTAEQHRLREDLAACTAALIPSTIALERPAIGRLQRRTVGLVSGASCGVGRWVGVRVAYPG